MEKSKGVDESAHDRQGRESADMKVVPLRPKPVRKPPRDDDGGDGPGPGRAA